MAGMKDTLTLRYSGPLVDEGRMDAYETAACIMAFADFLGVAAQAAHARRPGSRLRSGHSPMARLPFSLPSTLPA